MKTNISCYQAKLIIIIVILGTAIVFYPSLIIQSAGQDAWITVIILTIATLLFSLLLFFLSKKMGGKDLVSFSRVTLGRFITLVLILPVILVFLFLAGGVSRQTAELLITSYFLQTPLWFINITIIITSAVLVYYGIEVMGRSLEILFYLYLAAFLFVILLLVGELSLEKIQPVLAGGFPSIIKSLYPGSIVFSETFFILILAPQIWDKQNILKTLIKAVLFAGTIFLISVLTLITLFGPELAGEFHFPLVNATSYIKAFDILERLDPLFIFFWVGGGVFKTAFFIYGAVYLTQKLALFKTYYPFLPLVLPVTYYFASLHFAPNIFILSSMLQKATPIILLLFVAYPVILVILSQIRGIDFNEKS